MSALSQESTVVSRGCLYRPQSKRRNTLNKQVSFPDDDSRLVTGFMEAPNPWEYADDVDRDKLIQAYSQSCVKHGHRPSGSVLKQLEAMDLNGDRSCSLDLKGELLDAARCESLEEILKRVQFSSLILESTSLDDEGAVAIFDMIEYYESATHVNISSNQNIAARGWQACARMIKKTQCLDHLEARNITLNEQIIPILSRSLRITAHLHVLKLENSRISGRPLIILGALKLNTGLRELYLADNDLGITDALQLAALLRSNTTLQLLDVSNNNIQDGGASHIVDGIIEQPMSGDGLGILVLWNNRLTRNCAPHFARALAQCRSLEMLNIGHNVLSSDVLHALKDSLQQNKTLLRLGMQSTYLTCEGAIALAEVIEDNRVIQRIDLRDNAIYVAGLKALALCMKSNQSVTQLDLDDVPKKKSPDMPVADYRRLVLEIRGYCSRNEEVARAEADEEEDDISEVSDSERSERRVRLPSMSSRKISLTCQTLLRSVAQDNGACGLLAEPRRSGGRLRSPAPSPVPSPVSSPMPSPAPSPGPARNRFRVSQVSESDSLSSSPGASPSSSPTCFFPSSRFKVTVVEPTSPIIPTNSVTMGFSYNNSNSSCNRDPATPDTDHEVQNIMSSANAAHASSSVQQSPVKQPPPQYQEQQPRSRKISWVQMGISSVTSIASDDGKASSSLERLLGLFQNPGSIFNKSPSPQTSSVPQGSPKKSPQSSPQLQRAAPSQSSENGFVQPKMGTNTLPVFHPDIMSSVRCANDRPLACNIGSPNFQHPAVVGHDGDYKVEDLRHQDRRDVLNNNRESDVAKENEKDACDPKCDSRHEDENLNVHKAEEVADVSRGGGGDDYTAIPEESSGPSCAPCPASASSSAPSEGSQTFSAEGLGSAQEIEEASSPAVDSSES